MAVDEVLICGGEAGKVPAGSKAPWIAHLYSAALFRADFRARFPAGETFSEWDMRHIGSGRSTINMTLQQINEDFRNYYAQTEKNKALAKKGVSPDKLKAGRPLRPDGLGLAIDPVRRAIVCELMECSTIDQAESTVKTDLVPKLALLRGPIKLLLDNKLRDLRSNMSMVPEQFLASGTPFIVPPELCLVPIFPTPAELQSGRASAYRWICFAPTFKYRGFPVNTPYFAGIEPENSPYRGLILYSYHETTDRVAVPVELLKRFRDWVHQQSRQYSSLGPQLLPLPAATAYWQDNLEDWKRLLGYVAVVSLGVALVVLTIYLAPVVAAAITPILTQIAAATSAEALAAYGSVAIAALSASLPNLLRTAQTALIAAVNMQPAFR